MTSISDSWSVVQIPVKDCVSSKPGWLFRCSSQAFRVVHEFVVGYLLTISGENVRILLPQCVKT